MKNKPTHLAGFSLLILLDLWSKDLVYTMLQVDVSRVTVLGDWLGIICRENPAGPFGLLSGLPPEVRIPVLVVMTMGALLIAPILLWTALPRGVSAATPLMLITAGAAGNMIDRLWRGAVIDFIDIRIGWWGGSATLFPTFNLADLMIFAGIALALIMVVRENRAVVISKSNIAAKDTGSSTGGNRGHVVKQTELGSFGLSPKFEE